MIVTPVIDGGDVVSSTAIREAVRGGRVEDARRMLGRPFALVGEIRPGTGQGRKLVVPTLNLDDRAGDAAEDRRVRQRDRAFWRHLSLGHQRGRAADV